jgi:hypothetical protein
VVVVEGAETDELPPSTNALKANRLADESGNVRLSTNGLFEIVRVFAWHHRLRTKASHTDVAHNSNRVRTDMRPPFAVVRPVTVGESESARPPKTFAHFNIRAARVS